MIMPTNDNRFNVTVKRLHRLENSKATKAFVDIVINDCLLIKGLRVVDGSKGLFVSMPREKSKDERWFDSVRPLSREARETIESEVLMVYMSEKEV